MVVIDGFLNRETRDGLSTGEQALLHDTFKYTGGGLVLTALGSANKILLLEFASSLLYS